MSGLSHADLCGLAVRWLYGAGKCKFVLREPTSGMQEQPDAIGWERTHTTILIECKASRADFLADKKKPHRLMPSVGMGGERYFLVPAGLVKPDELPAQWGLIYAYPSGQVRTVHKAQAFARDARNALAEDHLMFAMLRRFAQTGRWHQVEAAWLADVANEPRSLPAPLYDEVRP